jgi:type IV pilus assembly protein PilO
MSGKAAIWRGRLWVWLPALLFFLLNLSGWLYFRAGDFVAQVSSLEKRIQVRQERQKKLSSEEAQLRHLEESALTNRRRIEELYGDRLSTQRHRLTDIIKEVRRLAEGAGLGPSATSYPEETFEAYGLERKGFVFSVAGSYTDLRKFVNSLELTESFIVIDSVSLASAGEDRRGDLRISFRISTLFASEKGLEELGQPAEAGS